MSSTFEELLQTLRTLTKEKKYTDAYAVYKRASAADPHNGRLDLALGWIVWFDVLSTDEHFLVSRVQLVIRALSILSETVPDCSDTADKLMHIREKLFSETAAKLLGENRVRFASCAFPNLSAVYKLTSTKVLDQWFRAVGKTLASASDVMCVSFVDNAREYFTVLQPVTIYYLLSRKAKGELTSKSFEQAIASCQEALHYEGEQESIVHYYIIEASLALSHRTKDKAVQQQAHELARLHAILYHLKPVKNIDYKFYFDYGKIFAFFCMRREHFLCREYAVRLAKMKGAIQWVMGVKPTTSPYAEGISVMTDQALESELNTVWQKEAEQYHLLKN